MKTKAKSVQVYDLRLWSRRYYKENVTKKSNIFNGLIIDAKTKEQIHFDNAAELLTAIQRLYMKVER